MNRAALLLLLLASANIAAAHEPEPPPTPTAAAAPAPSTTTATAKKTPATPAVKPAKPLYQSTVEGDGPKSAASASTIRNFDFDIRPKNSPNDLLNLVPGLLAVQHQGGGKADQIFLRGFDADHGTDVAVYVDGVPINLPSHAHGQGYTDLHWLIPEAIDRMEVTKGPYDARYGDFATAGAVNFYTRKRFDSSEVSITLGGFPTLGCKSFPLDCKPVATERFLGIASPKLTGWAEKLHPWVAFELARDEGPFQNAEHLYRYNVFGKIGYDLSPHDTLGLFVSAYGSGWNGSGQIPAREVEAGRLSQFGAIDPSEGGLTDREMLNLYYQHKSNINQFDAQVYYVRSQLALFNDFTFFLRDPINGDEIEQDDGRSVVGANLTYHHHTDWRGFRLRTTVGAQLRYDTIHVDLWDTTSQNGSYRKRIARHVDASQYHFGNDDDISQLNIGAFAEEDIRWNRFVRTIVGLRADFFGFDVNELSETLGPGQPATSGTKQKSLLSPKATVVVTPLRALDLYFNFGMGFHSNDARLAVQEGQVTPDGAIVNVVPRLYGGEFGARLTLWDRFTVAAALWASYLENETVFDGDAGVFLPADPTRRWGVDVEARAHPLSWLFLDLDVAQASATSVPNAGNGGAIALAPTLYLTGGVTVEHGWERAGRVRGGLRFRYLADRPAFDETSPEYQMLNAIAPDRVNAQGYFLVDLYGAYRYRWFEVAVAIQNLFNTNWREAQFGNHSCTRDETMNPQNPNYAVCGVTLPAAQRTGVADVHFTPGVPFNLQLSVRAYF